MSDMLVEWDEIKERSRVNLQNEGTVLTLGPSAETDEFRGCKCVNEVEKTLLKMGTWKFTWERVLTPGTPVNSWHMMGLDQVVFACIKPMIRPSEAFHVLRIFMSSRLESSRSLLAKPPLSINASRIVVPFCCCCSFLDQRMPNLSANEEPDKQKEQKQQSCSCGCETSPAWQRG